MVLDNITDLSSCIFKNRLSVHINSLRSGLFTVFISLFSLNGLGINRNSMRRRDNTAAATQNRFHLFEKCCIIKESVASLRSQIFVNLFS